MLEPALLLPPEPGFESLPGLLAESVNELFIPALLPGADESLTEELLFTEDACEDCESAAELPTWELINPDESDRAELMSDEAIPSELKLLDPNALDCNESLLFCDESPVELAIESRLESAPLLEIADVGAGALELNHDVGVDEFKPDCEVAVPDEDGLKDAPSELNEASDERD